MTDTIDQFMWGFQPHFSHGVESSIDQVLSQIGLRVNVRVVLVGFAQDSDERHQICVEPETGPLSVQHLETVVDQAVDNYRTNPESEIHITDSRSHGLRHERLLRRSRADALGKAIEDSGAFEGLAFFASDSTPINKFEVHTCVGIPTETLDSLPALDNPFVDQIYVGQSLQHEVISECLRRADQALHLPDPGADLNPIGAPDDIIKTAAKRFTDGAAFRVQRSPSDLFRWVDSFTSLMYERAGANGILLIAPRGKFADQALIRFQKPIPLGQARTMRKLLEISGASFSVLADNRGAYGLGSHMAGTDVVEISIVDHATWELRIDGLELLRVKYGKASLPRPPLSFETFKDTAERIVGPLELNRIWSIITEAQGSGHGTALVVSQDAESEASRLGSEAVTIAPSLLEPEKIVRLGNVDGAVLLGPDGRCYAFGVILDGVANGQGDPARGSRFNSAIRYQSTNGANSIVVVISDDGMVNLVPQLMPRVSRRKVEEAVEAFRANCEADYVDPIEFYRTYERVNEMGFYLDDHQCRVVNELYDREMLRRSESGGIQVKREPRRPHPDMDDSYFL